MCSFWLPLVSLAIAALDFRSWPVCFICTSSGIFIGCISFQWYVTSQEFTVYYPVSLKCPHWYTIKYLVSRHIILLSAGSMQGRSNISIEPTTTGYIRDKASVMTAIPVVSNLRCQVHSVGFFMIIWPSVTLEPCLYRWWPVTRNQRSHSYYICFCPFGVDFRSIRNDSPRALPWVQPGVFNNNNNAPVIIIYFFSKLTSCQILCVTRLAWR